MEFRDLILLWLEEHHPDVKISEGVAVLPIKSSYLPKKFDGDVWYVFRIEDDQVCLFVPAKTQFGPTLAAGLPTFFEQLDAVIQFYKSYIP